MKYGKLISTWPSSASSFSTISRTICWKVWTVISRSCASRISTKRDMCVPLKWCGRPTYMLKVAMVCWAPPERSWILTGCRIALMPTWSMASLRESGLAWTSGMFSRSRAFIGRDFTIPTNLVGHCFFDRRADAVGVESDGGEQPRRIPVVDEPVRQAQHEDGFGGCQYLADRAASATHDLMLLHGHDEIVACGKLLHQRRVERLYEAHIGECRIERLGSFQRRLEHRAKGEDGDACAPPPDLSLAQRNRIELGPCLAQRCAARVAHRGGAVVVEAGGEHGAAFGGVGGGHDRQVRDGAQEGVVEGAVMGRAIAADQAAAVEGEQ